MGKIAEATACFAAPDGIRHIETIDTMKTKANKTTTKKPTATKERKESKCAFIDTLLEKGAWRMTAIAKLAAKKFNCDYDKTLATCRCRPTHMREAGRKPEWIREEAPAK
jgi:transposase